MSLSLWIKPYSNVPFNERANESSWGKRHSILIWSYAHLLYNYIMIWKLLTHYRSCVGERIDGFPHKGSVMRGINVPCSLKIREKGRGFHMTWHPCLRYVKHILMVNTYRWIAQRNVCQPQSLDITTRIRHHETECKMLHLQKVSQNLLLFTSWTAPQIYF